MRLLLAAALLALAGCAAAAAPRAPVAASRPAPRVSAAEVVRDGDRWTVEFRFSRASPAWLFAHSSVTREGGRPWRPSSWTVETPGVRIERRGRHDVMFAERGDVPPVVRVRFTPVSSDLMAEYDPALIFSDGSVALWSGHFYLRPVASVAAAEALPLDLNGIGFPGDGAQVTFRDRAGRVLHIGERFDSATLIEVRAYVLFGPLQPVAGNDIAAVIDPALPQWLKRELADSTPAILRRLTEALGPHGSTKPMLMVSWRGPTPSLASMGGSVLPGQIGMTFEGAGVVEENDELRGNARWFIAHEAVHFWLGNTVRYDVARDSWIMEGGADLLAARTIAAIDPAFDPRRFLQSAVDDCAALARRPVEQAAERGENRAFYACGSVFGMIAEAASRRPYSVFVKALVDANRGDGVLTRAEWLEALDRVSRDPTLSRDIGTMLSAGAADPNAMLASLFTRAGIAFTRGDGDALRLQ
jgi:hypothetical protein